MPGVRCSSLFTSGFLSLLLSYSGVVFSGEFDRSSDTALKYGRITSDERGVASIRFERQIDHPIDKVWKAITEPSSSLKFFSTADLQLGGQVSIRFSDEMVEFATITALDEPVFLEYVNNTTNGHPTKYYTDRLELTDHGESSKVVFTTVIGPKGPIQLRIAVGWHVWIDNWELLLGDENLKRAQLDATQSERENQVLSPYIDQLVGLYPGWVAKY